MATEKHGSLESDLSHFHHLRVRHLRLVLPEGRREGHTLGSSAGWLCNHSLAKVGACLLWTCEGPVSDTNLNVPIDGRYQWRLYSFLVPPHCWLQQQETQFTLRYRENLCLVLLTSSV